MLLDGANQRTGNAQLAKLGRDIERREPRCQIMLGIDLLAHEQAAACGLPIDLGQQRGLVAKTIHPRAQSVARLFEGAAVLREECVIAPSRDDLEGGLVGFQATDGECSLHAAGRSSCSCRSNSAATLSATRRTRGWWRRSSWTTIHRPCVGRSSGGVRRTRLASSAPA